MITEAIIHPVTGKTGKGYLRITSDTTVLVEQIKGEISSIKKGQLIPQKTDIHSFVIAENQEFKAGQSYEIHFEFDLAEDIDDSYKGVSFSYRYQCEFIFITQNTTELTPQTKKNTSIYFEVTRPKEHYRIETPFLRFFKLSHDSGIGCCIILVYILIVVIRVLSQRSYVEGITVTIEAVAVLSCILIYLFWIRDILKEIIPNKINLGVNMAHLNPREFSVQLSHSNDFKPQTCTYTIIEETIDRRGTSVSTHRNKLHTSEIQTINGNNSPIIFNYPTQMRLHTQQQHKDSRILWEITVIGKYKSISRSLTAEFIVNDTTNNTPLPSKTHYNTVLQTPFFTLSYKINNWVKSLMASIYPITIGIAMFLPLELRGPVLLYTIIYSIKLVILRVILTIIINMITDTIAKKINLNAEIKHLNPQEFSVQFYKCHSIFSAKECTYTIEELGKMESLPPIHFPSWQKRFTSKAQIINKDDAPITFKYPTQEGLHTEQKNPNYETSWNIVVSGKIAFFKIKLKAKFQTTSIIDKHTLQ